MIKADSRKGIVKLKGKVVEQLLEFSMITRSLKNSFPDAPKEALEPVFEIAMTADDEKEMVKKISSIIFGQEN